MGFFSRGRLLQFLIAKSVAEALLVTAVAAAFYLTTTNPHLRGWLDQADARTISGWAVDGNNAGSRVEVQLFIDDRFVENRLAADFRPDVQQAKRADDDWHGFVFKTPSLPQGEHEARVYAVHRGNARARLTLQEIGKPIRFRIETATAGSQAENPGKGESPE